MNNIFRGLIAGYGAKTWRRMFWNHFGFYNYLVAFGAMQLIFRIELVKKVVDSRYNKIFTSVE